MSFLTSLRFFFSTGWAECSGANFSVAIGWSFSARIFGALVGALFVRRLAIPVSFLSSLSHPSVLQPHESQFAKFVQEPSSTFGGDATDNPLPSSRIPLQGHSLLLELK